MLNHLYKLFRLIYRFGVKQGISLYLCELESNKISKIKLRFLKHPFYLRNNSTDISIFREIFLDLDYDFKLKFKPEFIIDCGANIGLTSIFFTNKYPDATIIAIEPDKLNFEMLLKNTGYYSNIKCINAGVWNKESYLKVEDKFGSGAACLITSEVTVDYSDKIKAYSISNILQKYEKTEIDILKIDIEGSEKELFKSGYEEWLPNSKTIMIELHDYYQKGSSKTFFTALNNYNFSIFHAKRNIFCVRE
jgi:FkbM family methyltransferase